ncbi:MAG TPA: NADH-quinone oxidoreductase subunit M [Thermoanaerobaculia bacterium]|nr:NADH-quinone oxidoreductase subunit M [Thermoanaerobaculia bacterium]
MTLLSLVIWLPIAAAVLLFFLPSRAETLIKTWGLLASLATFVFSLKIVTAFDATRAGFQFVETRAWIPQWGVNYSLGVDGISLWLVILTTFLTPVVFLSSWNAVFKHPKAYVASFLIMQGAMVGVFAATDLLLFYIFFELTLLPMYLVIGVWGGANRIYAAIKFFLFTIAGSLLMLLGIIYLVFQYYHQVQVPSFAILDLYNTVLPSKAQTLCFFAFALAFGIKVPLFPLHTWLPDAHVEAPTGGSIILAGVTLKMGTYGFLRFVLPLFPEASMRFTPLLITLAVIGIIYGALVAWVQPDMKKLVAYSSVSHLGFCVLGIFAMNQAGIEGSILQMVNHGISTGALFLLVGVIYERRHTRLLADYGGIARTMPVYATLFVIAMLSSVGLPGLNGFVGEFLILSGTFKSHPRAAVIAATGVILAAIYLLWLVQRVFFGPVDNDENRAIPDIRWNELAAMAPLVILMVWIGVHPNTFLRPMTPAVTELISVVKGGKGGKVMVAGASRSTEESRMSNEEFRMKNGKSAHVGLSRTHVEASRRIAVIPSGWRAGARDPLPMYEKRASKFFIQTVQAAARIHGVSR